MTLTYKTAEA